MEGVEVRAVGAQARSKPFMQAIFSSYGLIDRMELVSGAGTEGTWRIYYCYQSSVERAMLYLQGRKYYTHLDAPITLKRIQGREQPPVFFYENRLEVGERAMDEAERVRLVGDILTWCRGLQLPYYCFVTTIHYLDRYMERCAHFPTDMEALAKGCLMITLKLRNFYLNAKDIANMSHYCAHGTVMRNEEADLAVVTLAAWESVIARVLSYDFSEDNTVLYMQAELSSRSLSNPIQRAALYLYNTLLYLPCLPTETTPQDKVDACILAACIAGEGGEEDKEGMRSRDSERIVPLARRVLEGERRLLTYIIN